MSVTLKSVDKQVILITGASSGIGQVTAQTAASLGAKVILIARNEEALDTVAADIINAGGEAIALPADVGDPEAFRAAVEKGVARFGRIDTWVNNAGGGMYGSVLETDLEDDRKLFETNFWGVVNGSRLAVEHLRDSGGALINVGSVVSDVSIPPQGMYSASKHAVLGFTDALRIELQHAGLPISVTLIKPAAIDTPFPDHARNYYDKAASLPPPVYDPSIVASAILFAASHPRRELHAGGGGRLMSMLQREVPGLVDMVFGSNSMWAKNFADRPVKNPKGSLQQSISSADVHGSAGKSGERSIRTHSAYNAVAQHPLLTGGALAALAVAAVGTYLLFETTSRPDTWAEKAKRVADDAADRASDGWAGGVSHVTRHADKLSSYANHASAHATRVASDLVGQASDYVKQAGDYIRRAGGRWS